ncbi:hypothetical protein YH65_02170 [Sulfurovum lithotrophicum]|uniref:GGDEF domain-containing protein n=1 Tax=Sulfurovum lithotrophicum TaxID=206403 RepID=A0A7U4M020_9BACT|nr:bifunctional diguanylate cyclase/phosphodiesterase [Sulfurovum lithotrophicum]AKF24332.1 hypothetical protein YH65_02170 [Sulfurovum lithotrophicum]
MGTQEIGGIIMQQFISIPFTVLAVILILLILLYIFFIKHAKNKLQALASGEVSVMQKALETCTDAVLILSMDQKVLYANKSMRTLLHLHEKYENSILNNTLKVKVGKEWRTLGRVIKEKLSESEASHFTLLRTELLTQDKHELPVDICIDRIEEEGVSSLVWSIVSIHDLSQKKAKEDAEYYHRLTHLPNQIKAQYDLNALNARLHLSDDKLAVMVIDIDNLSVLRSIIGVSQSNLILKKFASYLTELSVKTGFKTYHTFYNNFLLIIPDVKDIKELNDLAQRIQKELSRFYKLGESRLHLSASIGIGVYPDSGPVAKLFDLAYRALTQAEKSGYGRVEFFLKETEKNNYDELILYNDMHAAIERKQFEVYYQPIVDTRNKEAVKAEALIRWHHPEYGLVPPDLFVSIAEKTGFIVELGKFVLDEVLKQQKRWELFKFRQIVVSINLSLLEIETGHFVKEVVQRLEHHQVNPELIQYEITEGLAMQNEKHSAKIFYELRKLGIGVVLDDFGTGYTSFSYLKRFPASILKIDKILIDNIVMNEEDQRIVKAIIDLGHSLGMKVVVEGVETSLMVELLEGYGCDYMQGYYFSKPLPVVEFQKMLRQ